MMKEIILLCGLIACSFLSNAQEKTASSEMKWSNEPKMWSVKGNKVSLITESKTDFWNVTYYGYTTTNGHFYYREMDGDFEATVKITGQYKELYDQAGLMIRIDSAIWIKSGVEFVNGKLNLSVVTTHVYSDWSVIPRNDVPVAVWLKLVRKNDSVELSYSVNGKDFEMQRLAYFPPKGIVQIGIMAAAPEGKGFSVAFENFKVKQVSPN